MVKNSANTYHAKQATFTPIRLITKERRASVNLKLSSFCINLPEQRTSAADCIDQKHKSNHCKLWNIKALNIALQNTFSFSSREPSYRIASKIQRISPRTFSYGHVNHNAKPCRHELTKSNNQITSRNCMTWQNLLSWSHLTSLLSCTKFKTKHKLWIIECSEWAERTARSECT